MTVSSSLLLSATQRACYRLAVSTAYFYTGK